MWGNNLTEPTINILIATKEDTAKVNKHFKNLLKEDSNIIREQVDTRVFSRHTSWQNVAYNLRAKNKEIKTKLRIGRYDFKLLSKNKNDPHHGQKQPLITPQNAQLILKQEYLAIMIKWKKK